MHVERECVTDYSYDCQIHAILLISVNKLDLRKFAFLHDKTGLAAVS